MRRIGLIISLAFIASIAAAACGGGAGGGGEGATAAAKSWFEAYAQLDLSKVKELTCDKEKQEIEKALALLGGGGELSAEALKDLFTIDVSGLKYEEKGANSSSATVHISGPLKVSVLGESQDEAVDQDVPLVNEGGAWKVCMSGLPGS